MFSRFCNNLEEAIRISKHASTVMPNKKVIVACLTDEVENNYFEDASSPYKVMWEKELKM